MLKRSFQLTAILALTLMLVAVPVSIGSVAPVSASPAASTNPGQQPSKGTGLQYRLVHVPENNEAMLLVTNPTRRTVTVTTPTAGKTDFVLLRNGNVVWRASQGKGFAGRLTNEVFRPGETKVYTQKLPALSSGLYLLQGYYLGETKWSPVATINISVQGGPVRPDPGYRGLAFSIEYLGSSGFNPSPRLRVTVKNESGKDLSLPYHYGYQILVKKPGASDYIGTVGIGESLGTLEAGATRYVFVTLDGLPAGTYQADVRSNVGYGYYQVVASTWLQIR